MKTTIQILLLLFMVSCLDVEVEPTNTFKKIDGPVDQSEGRNIVLQEDGSFIVLGSETISTKLVTRGPAGSQVVEYVREIVPSLARYNASGNLIEGTKKYYPILNYSTDHAEIDVKIGGNILFLEQVDNGFIAVGNWTEASFYLTDLDYQLVGPDAPFLMFIDSDFNLKSIYSLNGESPSHNEVNGDIVYHMKPQLIKSSSGKLYLLTLIAGAGDSIIEITSKPFFYAIREIDASGSVSEPNYFRSQEFNLDNRGQHFFENENGHLEVLNRKGDFVGSPGIQRIDVIDPNSWTILETKQLNLISDNDQIPGLDMFNCIKNENGGYHFFYANGQQRAFVSEATSNLRESYFRIFASDMLLIQSVTTTSDNGFAVLVEYDGRETGNSTTGLFKLNSNLDVEWWKAFDGYPRKVVETPDGGLLLVINPFFTNNNTKLTLIKLNKDGEL